LVTELSRRRESFRRLWARHDVAVAAPHVFRLAHPLVGALDLTID
jgi:hypothetical protein